MAKRKKLKKNIVTEKISSANAVVEKVPSENTVAEKVPSENTVAEKVPSENTVAEKIPSKKMVPAISIIIPLYNAEKYIGECLNSILAQTFQDYEVIVVDDCSTDKSCEVVENYVPKFGGRLELIRRKQNSGLPSAPSNTGIKMSRGKYIFLMDNDDIMTNTAMEELYKIAEDFQADLVHCEKHNFLVMNENGQQEIRQVKHEAGEEITKPLLISEDISERVKAINSGRFYWPLWTDFVRRDCIAKNNIDFLSVMGQDVFFTCHLVLAAKNIVIAPNVVYFHRGLQSSLWNQSRDTEAQKILERWIPPLVQGIEYLDKLLSQQEIFQKQTELKYILYDTILNNFTHYYYAPMYSKTPAALLGEIVKEKFSQFKDKDTIIAFLFAKMNILNLNVIQLQQQLNQAQTILQTKVQ